MGIGDWLAGRRNKKSEQVGSAEPAPDPRPAGAAADPPSSAPAADSPSSAPAADSPSSAPADAWRPHPALASAYPPDDRTFAGFVMVLLARGSEDRYDIEEHVSDIFAANDFARSFPDEPELTAAQGAQVLADVVAEYERLVPERSQDTINLRKAFLALRAQGIASSFGETFDAREGAREGYQKALRLAESTGREARGYVYSHTQDLDRLVVTGTLLVGFSDMSGDMGEDAVQVGLQVVEVLRAHHLPVTWDGTAGARIEVGPIRWEEPVIQS